MTPTATAASTIVHLDSKARLRDVLEELLLVLTQKEKDVITKRFALDDGSRKTLESIGQMFSVTRERVRQIEKIALTKLRRTIENTKLALIHQFAREVLEDRGSLCHEETLVSEVLKKLPGAESVDAHITVLALAVHPEFEKTERNLQFHPFWRLNDLSETDAKNLCQIMYSALSKKKDIIVYDAFIDEIKALLKEKGVKISEKTILSALEVDKRFKKTKNGIGLMSWRHINPRSIRDKAYIVLKQENEAIHFVEIANRILAANFDKKTVTVQAVHNELIRDEMFVLVGRGLYALKEWGYKRGTVSEVIEDLLRKKSPLSKKEIIDGVLRQRQVKRGTISLNLQKNPHFARVGRAMYALDESKK